MSKLIVAHALNEALRRFAIAHGRQWKQALRDAWMNGRYERVNNYDRTLLQQLRNDPKFGPTGLDSYRLK